MNFAVDNTAPFDKIIWWFSDLRLFEKLQSNTKNIWKGEAYLDNDRREASINKFV